MKSENLADAGKAGQSYPAPMGQQPAISYAYPGPGSSGGTASTTNPYAPAAGDEKLKKGVAFVEIEKSSVILLESNPQQVKLHLIGSLPNPCHHLRVNPSKPDAQNKIQLEVYSVSKPGEMCTDVIQEFDVEVPLGSYPGGHYSIYINEELLSEFDL